MGKLIQLYRIEHQSRAKSAQTSRGMVPASVIGAHRGHPADGTHGSGGPTAEKSSEYVSFPADQQLKQLGQMIQTESTFRLGQSRQVAECSTYRDSVLVAETADRTVVCMLFTAPMS